MAATFPLALRSARKVRILMKARVACVVATLLLFGAVGSAQSVASLLQKGIYTHETLGDLDAAIRIYEQVIASAPAGSDLRTQAERRLATARTQRKFVAEHPLLATVDAGTYRHTWTGTTFDVPEGWKLRGTGPSSDDGEMVSFSTSDPSVESVAVWMKKDSTAPDKVAARLDGAPVEKIGQRREQGYEDYQIREGSLQHLSIGGQPALFAIGDFRQQGSDRPMSEYLMWIYTEKSRVFFFARVPAEGFEQLRRQIDAMVNSAIVP
jgi:hypothetical protein